MGVAPIQYLGEDGKIEGISISVLNLIAEMSGLSFEYSLYSSIEERYKNNPDIIFGIPPNYLSSEMILSKPYLKSETILYFNKSIKSYNLENKIYAAVRGSELPEGVKKERAIYFNTREESLNAVEKGRADYGFGNKYSIMFYGVQNNYKNIVVIPKEKEPREYCIALLKKDDILLSIINKTIDAIDADTMQSIILKDATHIRRKVSISMIIESYGALLFIILFVILTILLASFIYNLLVNKKLKFQNKKYRVLSNISNEYLYEYDLKRDSLVLSEKYREIISSPKSAFQLTKSIKQMLTKYLAENIEEPITLTLESGEKRTFKAINSVLDDKNGTSIYVIGKLVDISKETKEQKRLITMAERDGLTALYNAVTTAYLVKKSIEGKDDNKLDALVLLDCDNFKKINDTYGHMVGDDVLKHVAASLKKVFRENDLIGRMGGDEFCVYIKDIPSTNFVDKKILQLNKKLSSNSLNNNLNISISVGAAFVNKRESYKKIFEKADKALYKAKNSKKKRI